MPPRWAMDLEIYHRCKERPVRLEELHDSLVEDRARQTRVNVRVCLRCLRELVTEWANVTNR